MLKLFTRFRRLGGTSLSLRRAWFVRHALRKLRDVPPGKRSVKAAHFLNSALWLGSPGLQCFDPKTIRASLCRIPDQADSTKSLATENREVVSGRFLRGRRGRLFPQIVEASKRQEFDVTCCESKNSAQSRQFGGSVSSPSICWNCAEFVSLVFRCVVSGGDWLLLICRYRQFVAR